MSRPIPQGAWLLLVIMLMAIIPASARGQDLPPDLPLPPGSADAMEARMRARREAQAAARAGLPVPPVDTAPTGRGFGGGGMLGRVPGGFVSAEQAQVDTELRRQAPVFVGADPAQIEPSGKLITQIIPLKYAEAYRVRQDLIPLLSPEALITTSSSANCLVIVDTSAHVRRVVEIIAALEKETAQRPPTGPSRGVISPMLPRATTDLPLRPAENGILQTPAALYAPPVRVAALHDGMVVEAHTGRERVIKKGELLLRLDSRELDAQIAADQARIQALQLTIRRVPASAREELATQQAQLAALQASLHARQIELELLTVRAPADGQTMLEEQSNPVLVPGAYVLRGTIIAIIAGPSDVLKFKVLAQDAPRLRIGQKLTFSRGAAQMTGEITYISPAAEHVSVESPNRDKIIEQDTVYVQGKITSDPPQPTPGSGTAFSGTVTLTLDR